MLNSRHKTYYAQNKELWKKRYADRRTAGLCVCCAAPSGAAVVCVVCTEKKKETGKRGQAARRAQWCADGRCGSCGGEKLRDGYNCDACLAKQRKANSARLQSRTAEGCCYRCSARCTNDEFMTSEKIKYKQCSVCYFKQMAKLHTGSSHNWSALRSKFRDQNGRCCYTNDVLVLGDNASIDHRHPRARGGKDEVTNLQWVTKQVNFSKDAMSHEEFVALCRRVAACCVQH